MKRFSSLLVQRCHFACRKCYLQAINGRYKQYTYRASSAMDTRKTGAADKRTDTMLKDLVAYVKVKSPATAKGRAQGQGEDQEQGPVTPQCGWAAHLQFDRCCAWWGRRNTFPVCFDSNSHVCIVKSTPTAHTFFSCTAVAQACCQSVQSHIDPMRMHGSRHDAHCLRFAQKQSHLIAQCRTSRHT